MILDLAIETAAKILLEGGLVAFPSETVYGLGANALSQEACKKIFEAKGRPANNPLIVHVDSIEEAEKIAYFNNYAHALSIMWPGPLTMVLPLRKTSGIANCVTAGLDTIALRIPAHHIARKLIKVSGVPIAAPSANKSGRLSPTQYEHVVTDFGNQDIFILQSDQKSQYGIESTIIDLSTSTPVILRPGFITPELLSETLNRHVNLAANGSLIKAPGMFYKHYAPITKLRINAEIVRKDEVALNFGNSGLVTTGAMNLSKQSNLAEAAANLFAFLHQLDDFAQKNSLTAIAVAPIPNESIGLAINDRLARAASNLGFKTHLFPRNGFA